MFVTVDFIHVDNKRLVKLNLSGVLFEIVPKKEMSLVEQAKNILLVLGVDLDARMKEYNKAINGYKVITDYNIEKVYLIEDNVFFGDIVVAEFSKADLK
jgi:hypothetical protein